MTSSGRVTVCVRCGLLKPHRGRGLCNNCHQRLAVRLRAGLGDELLDYPRLTRSRADVVEDATELADAGVSVLAAVVRLGYKPRLRGDGLYQMLRRAGRLDLYARLAANGR